MTGFDYRDEPAPERVLADPGTPTRSEYARVRRAFLADLRRVAEVLRFRIDVWSAGKRVYDSGSYDSGKTFADGRTWAQSWRWRQWVEYPENSPVTLAREAARLRELASSLNEIADNMNKWAIVASAECVEHGLTATGKEPK